MSGALAFGDEAEPVRREQARLRQAAVAAGMRGRFERAVREGDLPGGRTVGRWVVRTRAGYVAKVLNGLAVQAASGATEKKLRQVAALAMRAWPTRPLAPRRPGNTRALTCPARRQDALDYLKNGKMPLTQATSSTRGRGGPLAGPG